MFDGVGTSCVGKDGMQPSMLEFTKHCYWTLECTSAQAHLPLHWGAGGNMLCL